MNSSQIDVSVPVFDHNLIKIVSVQMLARELISGIWLFWTFFLYFMTDVILLDFMYNKADSKYKLKNNDDSNI